MNLTTGLLYLLLLYAVLDKDGKLSLTTGLIIAFAILLFNCYFGNRCTECATRSTSSGNVFNTINGF